MLRGLRRRGRARGPRNDHLLSGSQRASKASQAALTHATRDYNTRATVAGELPSKVRNALGRSRRSEPCVNIQLSKSDLAFFKKALGVCATPCFECRVERGPIVCFQ